jgi:glycosyltransferase involved in cell wall biosynthesis
VTVPDPLRIAYTLEQCWHDVPGGTAVAALRVADELRGRPGVELVGVAGRHPRPPAPAWRPSIAVRQLPLARPWLYETWLRVGWPPVERATGPVDVTHATALVPAPSTAPLVVTVHDVAFLRTPDRFTRHGVRVMRRSLDVIRRRADLVLCSSRATMDDVAAAGVDADRLRHVPLGTSTGEVEPDDVAAVRDRFGLPDRFVLFVGTLEPRKNLTRLAAAVGRLDEHVPLVVVGADGWGGVAADLADHAAAGADVRFLGFVAHDDLAGLYAAASVFAYPSEWEGFGLPVAEAMGHGAPVVTSRGTSAEEVAGGAAVLVDPFDVDDIARGLADALADRERLVAAGRVRASELTWSATADATLAAYRELAR